MNVLRARFPRPKDKSSAAQTKGVVDKIVCSDCDFVYYGQTDRALQTRIKNTKGQFAFGTVTQKWLFELRAFAMSRVFCETLSHAHNVAVVSRWLFQKNLGRTKIRGRNVF